MFDTAPTPSGPESEGKMVDSLITVPKWRRITLYVLAALMLAMILGFLRQVLALVVLAVPLCAVYAWERSVPRSGDLSGGRRLRW